MADPLLITNWQGLALRLGDRLAVCDPANRVIFESHLSYARAGPGLSSEIVWEVALRRYEEPALLDRSKNRLISEISTPTGAAPLGTLMAWHERVVEQIVAIDKGGRETRVREILIKMGVPAASLKNPWKELDPLAAAAGTHALRLLSFPDWLVLDLWDIAGIDMDRLWLAKLLRGYPGAVLIASPDREYVKSFGAKRIERAAPG